MVEADVKAKMGKTLPAKVVITGAVFLSSFAFAD